MARTQRERDAERRAEKLADVAAQVADGTLTVRQMTDAEREAYAPAPRPPRPDRGDPPRRRGR